MLAFGGTANQGWRSELGTKAHQHKFRGLLFGTASAGATTLRGLARVRQDAGHPELLFVLAALDGDDVISWQGPPAGLQPLLQKGLGVLSLPMARGLLQGTAEEAQNHCPGGRETGIQEDGTKHGLQGIFQNGIPAMGASAGLARAEPQVIAQFDVAGEPRQGFFLDQGGPGTTQVPLVGTRETLPNRLSDYEAQQGISQKFEALVTDTGGAAMGQGLLEQLGMDEVMPEGSGQATEIPNHA